MSAPTPDWVTEILADLPALITADEVAGVLRCSRRSVSRMVADGRLLARRHAPGGPSKLLIPRGELAKYLASMGAA